MKLKVLIVEDDPITAHDLGEVLSAHQFEIVGICKSYEDALITYHSKNPDAILADIKLKGEKDGIDLVNQINSTNAICPVVYLTGNSDEETKTRAFNTNPATFLIKPFNANNVVVSLELALNRFNKQSASNKSSDLFVKKGDQFLKINIQEIKGLKAEGSYCRLFTSNDEFLISGNLKLYANKLDGHFTRIHRSFLVNKNKVTSFDAHSVKLENLSFPIGRKFKDEVKKLFL